MKKKIYLGDAVYVEIDRGMIKLTTEDGYRATNTIYLEHDVMENLIQYYGKVTEPPKEDEARN